MDIYYNNLQISMENTDGLKKALLNNSAVADDERTIEDLMFDLYSIRIAPDYEGYYAISYLDCEIDEQDMDEMTETIAPFVKDGSFIVAFNTSGFVPDFKQYYFKDGKCTVYWAELYFGGSPLTWVSL